MNTQIDTSAAPVRVCVVITARASYSRFRSALEAIRDDPGLELHLVVAASALLDRYGAVVDTIERDGFDIAARVFMVLEGENLLSMAKTTGLGLIELSTVFDNLEPDLVVTIADRYETLATAVAASYMNLPLVHIQGGEITGSIDDRVRNAVTKLADLHLVASEGARERVIGMGESPGDVVTTGCPSIDVAAAVSSSQSLGFDPFEKYGGVGDTFNLDEGYLVVLQHPVTTEYQLAREQVLTTLRAVNDLDRPTLWFWPNVDAGSDGTSGAIRTFRELDRPRRFHFFKGMQPVDFLALLKHADCLVGNSSVGIRECSFLGVSAVNIGSRQQGRDRGPNVVDVDHDRKQISDAIRRASHESPAPSDLYGDGKAGPRIAEALARYASRKANK